MKSKKFTFPRQKIEEFCKRCVAQAEYLYWTLCSSDHEPGWERPLCLPEHVVETWADRGGEANYKSRCAEQIELTFDQVDEILDSPLPKSANKPMTGWTDIQPKIQHEYVSLRGNGA